MTNTNQQLSIRVLEAHLAKLCHELGSEPIPLAQGREAQVAGMYDGREVNVCITLREDLQLLMMRAPVAVLADPNAAAAAQALLLGLNLSPGDVMGAAFAMSPADGTVYLVSSVTGPEVHFANFRASFLRLFALASKWQGQLTASPAFDSLRV